VHLQYLTFAFDVLKGARYFSLHGERKKRPPMERGNPKGQRIAMNTIRSALIALSLLAAIAAPASAAEKNCTVSGWTNGQGNHPIYACSDEAK
jgi:hypothetical protein